VQRAWELWSGRYQLGPFGLKEISQKEFKPKFPDIPKQADYKKFRRADWAKFPTNKEEVGVSNIDSKALKSLADSLGCSDIPRLNKTLEWIKNGAEIGCKGDARCPTFSKNSKEAYKVGHQVTDAIACWIRDKYVQGPVEEEDVPVEAKVNGILTRLKPNGSVRVILNLSAPAGASVNDGIDSAEFPAKMSSTKAWLKVLNKAGRSCWITKVDWSDAYKHITVGRKI